MNEDLLKKLEDMHLRLDTLIESMQEVEEAVGYYYSDVLNYITRCQSLCEHEIYKIRWETRTEEEKEADSKIFAACLSESEVSRSIAEKVEKMLKAREFIDE